VKLTASVPATVANLGPGFDCLALAADLANEISVDPEGPPEVTVEGEGETELPADDSNLVLRSMAHLARETGTELPALAMRCRNAIPLERGLGSSASAVVGGLALADRLLATRLSPQALLGMAVELEGHADNAAAALHGGVVLAYREAGGSWRVERLRPDPSLRPALLVPETERVSTESARRVLPEHVPLETAAFNAARAALLVLGLTTAPHLLREALRDRLHQGSRLRLAPASDALFRQLVMAGIPTCVAGSGPSLLAFEDDAAAVPDPGPGWRLVRTRIDPRGIQVEEGGARP
jgi:homoserine kinase